MTLHESTALLLSDRLQVPYLVVSGLCLLLAIHYLRRALAPIGVLVNAVAAVLVVIVAISLAVLFLTGAALVR
jgi:hypothetical protein